MKRMTTNQEKLQRLQRKLEKETVSLPLAGTPAQIVPPEGNPQASLMFIGEAAGFHEQRLRRPFVGAAGKLLTQSLLRIGIRREDIWITNVLKARPPLNREPLPDEIEAYRPYLDAEIQIIAPKLIVTLGRTSLRQFLPNASVSRVHGQALWVDWGGGRQLIFPMYHPAAALRSDAVRREFQQDLTKLAALLPVLETQDRPLVSQTSEPVPPSANQEDPQPTLF